MVLLKPRSVLVGQNVGLGQGQEDLDLLLEGRLFEEAFVRARVSLSVCTLQMRTNKRFRLTGPSHLPEGQPRLPPAVVLLWVSGLVPGLPLGNEVAVALQVGTVTTTVARAPTRAAPAPARVHG